MSDGDCHRCSAGKTHSPTIGLISGVVVLVGILTACLSKKCQRRKTDTPPSAFYVETEKLYVLAEVKFFTLFLAAQVETERDTRKRHPRETPERDTREIHQRDTPERDARERHQRETGVWGRKACFC